MCEAERQNDWVSVPAFDNEWHCFSLSTPVKKKSLTLRCRNLELQTENVWISASIAATIMGIVFYMFYSNYKSCNTATYYNDRSYLTLKMLHLHVWF